MSVSQLKLGKNMRENCCFETNFAHVDRNPLLGILISLPKSLNFLDYVALLVKILDFLDHYGLLAKNLVDRYWQEIQDFSWTA